MRGSKGYSSRDRDEEEEESRRLRGTLTLVATVESRRWRGHSHWGKWRGLSADEREIERDGQNDLDILRRN